MDVDDPREREQKEQGFVAVVLLRTATALSFDVVRTRDKNKRKVSTGVTRHGALA